MVLIGRNAFIVLAALLVIGLFGLVFLAGLGVFAGASNFATHRDTGYALTLLPLLMIVAGLAGRMERRLVLASLGVGLLFVLQSVFIAMREDNPTIAALHPVNGFLILLITAWILRGAWASRQAAA